MESFGDTLRKTREEKNIDIDTAVRETSISRQYIEALEKERTDVFPGETYLVGFLRNYSEYLGIDSKRIIALYKAKKIQESPVPEGLLHSPPSKILKPLLFSLIFLCLIAGGVCVYLFVIKPNTEADRGIVAVSAGQQPAEYTLTVMPIQKRIYIGDKINVPLDAGEYQLVVEDTLSVLALGTPQGTQFIELGEEVELDINDDRKADIIVYVSDISMDSAARGADVRMLIKAESASRSYEPVDLSVIPETSTANSTEKQTVILQDTRAYPFTLNVVFRGTCNFRYQSDSKESVEQYFVSDDTLIVQSSNGIRLWMSNANSVKMQIIANTRTYELEIGKAGQVLVQDIKWIKDTDGKYKLAVIELD
jgi:cytoskeletal protein RodZ